MGPIKRIPIVLLFATLLPHVFLPHRVGAIDDPLSFKSLVLGSLASGENVSGRYAILCTNSGCETILGAVSRTSMSSLSFCAAHPIRTREGVAQSCHAFLVRLDFSPDTSSGSTPSSPPPFRLRHHPRRLPRKDSVAKSIAWSPQDGVSTRGRRAASACDHVPVERRRKRKSAAHRQRSGGRGRQRSGGSGRQRSGIARAANGGRRPWAGCSTHAHVPPNHLEYGAGGARVQALGRWRARAHAGGCGGWGGGCGG